MKKPTKKLTKKKDRKRKGGATRKISGASLEKKLKTAANKIDTARKSVTAAQNNYDKANLKLTTFSSSLEKLQEQAEKTHEKLSLANAKLEKALYDHQTISTQLNEYRGVRHFSPKVHKVSKPKSI